MAGVAVVAGVVTLVAGVVAVVAVLAAVLAGVAAWTVATVAVAAAKVAKAQHLQVGSRVIGRALIVATSSLHLSLLARCAEIRSLVWVVWP